MVKTKVSNEEIYLDGIGTISMTTNVGCLGYQQMNTVQTTGGNKKGKVKEVRQGQLCSQLMWGVSKIKTEGQQ